MKEKKNLYVKKKKSSLFFTFLHFKDYFSLFRFPNS